LTCGQLARLSFHRRPPPHLPTRSLHDALPICPAYDPELAADLVEELKAEGDWNGEVTLLANTSPENVETGVMIKAMLDAVGFDRSEEHTSELQSRFDLVCRLLLEKKK